MNKKFQLLLTTTLTITDINMTKILKRFMKMERKIWKCYLKEKSIKQGHMRKYKGIWKMCVVL